MSDLREAVRKHALLNAAQFGGKANPKAVVGKVMGERPDLRARSKEVAEAAEEIISQIAGMPLDEVKRQAEAYGSEVRKKAARRVGLPDLDGAEEGKVVMRVAPGPSGPLHLGHTRVAVLNDEYVKRYGGRYINRLEDTNPEKIDPDAYRMIPEDLEWLGARIDETFIQSDRFQIYYDMARRLIDLGRAYVCTCEAETWRGLKEKGQACPHRDQSVEEAHEGLDRILSHGYGEGEAVFVIKTDLRHPNPAVRDFIGLRIVDSVEHPRTKDRYVAYPMMNFSVAVDDHLMGMTHVIRGKDHLNNTVRQGYIFDHMSWPRPRYFHYGLVRIPETVLKTSTMGAGVRSGEYTGWDDVRLGTVRALARRGITAQAVRDFWNDVGMKEVDMEFSWDNLYAFNKRVVDPAADRFFFVADPQAVAITGAERLESRSPLHPDRPELGERHHVLETPIKVLLAPKDLETLRASGRARLKDLCNVRWDGSGAVYDGNDLEALRQGVRIMHWAPVDGPSCQVLMPDGSLASGVSEALPTMEVGKVVQFERFGFARVESVAPVVKACYAHD